MNVRSLFPPKHPVLDNPWCAFIPNGSAFQETSHKWNCKCGFVWVCLCDFLLPFYFLKTGSDIAEASPDLPVYLRMILNFQVFSFHSPFGRITDGPPALLLFYVILGLSQGLYTCKARTLSNHLHLQPCWLVFLRMMSSVFIHVIACIPSSSSLSYS